MTSASLQQMHTLAETLKLGLDDGTSAGSNASASAGANSTGATTSTLDPTRRAEAIASGRLPYRELQHLYEEMADRLRRVTNEKEELAFLAQQRQEAFLRTEEKMKEDMRLLEVRLSKLGAEDRARMDPLRSLHGNIQDTIGSIQAKTARVLQDQERDLIRAFRARLADVTVELENERKKNESGSAEWVARCRKLTEELEWLRDLTDKLTSENKSVLKDNRRFKRQMKTQEEDREFLIKQLVSVKKENARLRYSFDQLSLTAGANGANGHNGQSLAPDQPMLQPPGTGTVSSITGLPMSQPKPMLRAGTPVTHDPRSSSSGANTPGFGNRSNAPSRPQSAFVQPTHARPSTAGQSRPGTAAGYPATQQNEYAEKEQRYKAMIAKLQRQVEDGQRSYRQLRTSYTAELASRTELQGFLKKCIDDVRQDMAERGRSAALRRAQGAAARASSASRTRSATTAPPPPLDPRQIPLAEFTPQDRINVLEWLMSQDAVIFSLYEQIFPQHARAHSQQASAAAAQVDQELQQQQPAPGSLFTATHHSQQYAPSSAAEPATTSSNGRPPRPSSSPAHQAATLGGVGVPRARPQTVGPGQMRAFVAGVGLQAQSSATPPASTGTYQASSQYERPFVGGVSGSSRPMSAARERPERPRTASAHSSRHASSGGGASSSTAQQQYHDQVEAEMRAARSHQLSEDEEDDEEDPDRHLYEQQRVHEADGDDSEQHEDD